MCNSVGMQAVVGGKCALVRTSGVAPGSGIRQGGSVDA
jgi:hypothetical protein